MANSFNSSPYMESKSAIQPRRLKDFLQDQNLSFPRHRKSTISVFLHAAVSSVKSSSILRRSISRRFSKSTRINKSRSQLRLPEPTMARTTSVTIKDILRWKSFRDLADPEENKNKVTLPSDFTVESESPSRCTTTTATTTSTGTPRSSWCDSDFTVGDSPVWCRGFSGDIDVTGKKNFHINVANGESLRHNTRDPKNQIVHEEEEQQCSPISVLDFAQEHEETFSSFHQVLANIERRNFILKQQIHDFENLIEVENRCLVNKNIELDDTESFRVEEKAIQLLDHIKTTTPIQNCNEIVDDLLVDFFRNELITSKEVDNNGEFESRVLRMANSWVIGEGDGSLNWGMKGKKEVCVLEMEKRGKWKDFEDEQQDIGIEIATMVFDHLLHELSMDLFII